MKTKFRLSEGANSNHLATIARVGDVFPIEGADKIQRTVINGEDMVISKSIVPGTIVVYFPIKAAICEQFLSVNNLYEIGEWQKNANAETVGSLIAKSKTLKDDGKLTDADALMAEAKAQVGFFNKQGRVRPIKLKGVYSNGFIAGIDAMVKFDADLANEDWENLIGHQFNYVGDTELCWKYIPPVKERPEHLGGNQKRWLKRMKKLKRFDRIIPDTFEFHYETLKLVEHIDRVNPDDIVTITVKNHGTSIILANIPVNRNLSVWEKVKKFIGFKVPTTEYGNVYSSRSVIKNQYINNNVQNFYEADVWGCVNRDFARFIEKDMTVYGEVVGYVEGTSSMIQKDHDYGCNVGEWKFMPYRISTRLADGKSFEWNVSDVLEWTMKIAKENPELASKILPIEILYHGRLGDLYPDLDENQHWHENLLAKMKVDTDRFGMELKEPQCHLYEKEANAAKVVLDKAIANGEPKKIIAKLQKEYEKWEEKRAPREGVVIRIDNDPKAEAWKLKTNAHFHREDKQDESGEVDIEEIA